MRSEAFLKGSCARRTAFAFAVAAALLFAGPALAHDISDQARQSMLEGSLVDVAWIGADHMLTGWDHLLFLLGVLFFLNGFGQIVRFITAFTIGHTITLLGATVLGITANAYLIDAVIALTVCYKAFENLGLFRRWFGVEAPNLLYMVFLFGLIDGFGLSTRVQQMTLIEDPQLLPKILAFNVGVELGQIAALCLMIGVVRLSAIDCQHGRFAHAICTARARSRPHSFASSSLKAAGLHRSGRLRAATLPREDEDTR